MLASTDIIINRWEYRDRLRACCNATCRRTPPAFEACARQVLGEMAREQGVELEDAPEAMVVLWPAAMHPDEV